MTDAPQLDPQVLAYLTERANQRATRAATAMHTLTRFERRVVREAAVMGYVLGERYGRSTSRAICGNGGSAFPSDFDIVRQVLEHCDSTADLYPYLAAACNGRRRRITRKRLFPGEETTS